MNNRYYNLWSADNNKREPNDDVVMALLQVLVKIRLAILVHLNISSNTAQKD